MSKKIINVVMGGATAFTPINLVNINDYIISGATSSSIKIELTEEELNYINSQSAINFDLDLQGIIISIYLYNCYSATEMFANSFYGYSINGEEKGAIIAIIVDDKLIIKTA